MNLILILLALYGAYKLLLDGMIFIGEYFEKEQNKKDGVKISDISIKIYRREKIQKKC